MASLNLFANIDNFDDANYSIGEFNIDDDDDVVVELPEEKVSPKVAAKSKKGKGKGKAKSSKDKGYDLYTPDSDAPVVVPGIGQKTAFKKLSKLKESLATTTVSDPIKFRTRSAMNAGIRQAFETQQARKRFRLTELDEISFVNEAPLVQQSLQSANTNDSFDEDELSVNVKIRWEGTSKIEKMEFSMYKSFKELIDRLSMRDRIDAKSFLLMLGDQVIKPDDSPHSIGYTLGKFICDYTISRIIGMYCILKCLALTHCTLYIHYKPVVSMGGCSLALTMVLYLTEALYFRSSTLTFYVIFPCVLNSITLVGLIYIPKRLRLWDPHIDLEDENSQLLKQIGGFKKRRSKKLS